MNKTHFNVPEDLRSPKRGTEPPILPYLRAFLIGYVVGCFLTAICFVLFYPLNAHASSLPVPQYCTGTLVSDLHKDPKDPLHYDHSCVMADKHVCSQDEVITGDFTWCYVPTPDPVPVTAPAPVFEPIEAPITYIPPIASSTPTATTTVSSTPPVASEPTVIIIREIVEVEASTTQKAIDEIRTEQTEQRSLIQELRSLIDWILNQLGFFFTFTV